MQYTLTSAYNRYGSWGLTDDVNNPYRNHKFGCLAEMLEDTLTISTKDYQIDKKLHNISVFPNPSSGTVTISYELFSSSEISFEVFDVFGRKVHSFDIGTQNQGKHTLTWDSQDQYPGIYYYRLIFGNQQSNGSIVLE